MAVAAIRPKSKNHILKNIKRIRNILASLER
jgi:hypothetical protein